MKTSIIQIAYDQATVKMLSDDERVYHVIRPDSGPYLENEIIVRFLEMPFVSSVDYIGVLSARFEDKSRWRQSPNKTIPAILDFIEQDKNLADVYSFFGGHTERNIWTKAEQWQPGILDIAERLFDIFEQETKTKVGDITKLETPIIYQNAFIAKSAIYSDYVKTFLKPLTAIMERDKHLIEWLNQNANYKDSKLNKEKLLETFGRPFYTFHPFVCERFFSTYLAINKNLFTLKHI